MANGIDAQGEAGNTKWQCVSPECFAVVETAAEYANAVVKSKHALHCQSDDTQVELPNNSGLNNYLVKR